MTEPLRPRDYIGTGNGLWFAIVSPLMDQGRYLASLRYTTEEGRLRTLYTASAAALLHERHPEWIARSGLVDAVVHLVPADAVTHRLRTSDPIDLAPATPVRARAAHLLERLAGAGVPRDRLGFSGSLRLGAETDDSDIDLVARDHAAFELAREAIRTLIAEGRLGAPSRDDWEEAWRRRGSPRTLDEYIWHEERKGTKALLEGTRIDLSLVPAVQGPLPAGTRKVGRDTITAVVTDDRAAFEHPARFRVDHPRIVEVMSFTPTYAGQAQSGETLEASGWIEEDERGLRRLVVGTSREAAGEWIRTVRR